jgi:ribonuclease HII
VLYYERKFKRKGYDCIIGVDEAGRGPLAGPVVAAAVTLKKRRFKNRIDDSKRLTARQRECAFLEIIDNSVFGIGVINEKVIDRLNILVATRVAMEHAIFNLLGKIRQKGNKRIHIIVDGNVGLKLDLPVTHIIKGDSRSKSIASASILAKVTRDRIMACYDKVYPQYGFCRHKGYGTPGHRVALKKYGPSIIHRTSFSCV